MSSVYYSGLYFAIRITDDGAQSIRDLAAVHRASLTAELARGDKLIRQFADSGRLRSPDQFRQEGPGFWAIRAGHLRFYGWYEPDRSFVISHVIYKMHDKLEEADKNRMRQNQAAYRNVGTTRGKKT